ncbi:MAG: hypothetical protein KAJ15_09740, partial [Spirochaetes bacterium]|nr:hypothetical protein [Spirochaetota bacterium]
MNSKKALFSFVIYVVLAVLFVYPFGKLFMIGFVREGSPTFLNIADIMSKTTNLVALRHTLFVAVFVTILAVSAGVVLSWLV